jgi:uncharacterized damage-inducible protein DinB
MGSTSDLLVDGFDRVHELVHEILGRLSDDDLARRVGPRANSIGWLVWHLARVQDQQVSDAAGTEQRWTAEGWVDRFALPFDRLATGYGQPPEETDAVRVAPALLEEYFDAVHAASVDYVRGLGDADLDRVVDKRWDPPVTLGVRLVSILADDLQHAGQASYVKGLLGR